MKSPLMEAHPAGQAALRHTGLEHRPHRRQVEPARLQMRMGEGELDRHRPGCGADVDDAADPGPGEAGGERMRRRQADAGHGVEEPGEALGAGIDRGEGIAAGLGLVLRLAGAQRLGQVPPEGIEPPVGHLQDAADIGRLASVEIEIGLGRVGVDAVIPFQHPQRHQRVEEVANAALVQAELVPQRFAVERGRRPAR